MWMKIGYARVSTQDQNLDAQIDALEEAGCERIFYEKISGAKSDRPEFNACMEYLRDHAGDVLVAQKLDRIGRSMKHLVDLSLELEERGIGLHILDQDIKTDTAVGKFYMHICAAFASMELSQIRERTQAGLAAARKKGRLGGRPPAIPEDKLATAKALILSPDVPVRTAMRDLNICRKTYYRYRKKFLAEGAESETPQEATA